MSRYTIERQIAVVEVLRDMQLFEEGVVESILDTLKQRRQAAGARRDGQRGAPDDEQCSREQPGSQTHARVARTFEGEAGCEHREKASYFSATSSATSSAKSAFLPRRSSLLQVLRTAWVSRARIFPRFCRHCRSSNGYRILDG